MVEKFSIKSQGYNWPGVKRKEKKKKEIIFQNFGGGQERSSMYGF